MVKTYDPKKMIITFLGTPISGYADGTFLTITPSSERYTKSVGADGETARGKSNDNTHEVTITLLQSSLSNDVLSNALAADKIGNLGKGPLQVVDLNGTTLFYWDVAWIRQPPDAEYSKEVGERAWIFDTGPIVQENIGGNLS